jgi:ubiquinone/menaquinone biosynthesis C-methylase UbiE
MKSWIDYWNRPNGIFVSELHKRVHYEHIFANVKPFLPHGPGSALLDWGCGEAFAADWMATDCERVYLYDPAEIIRRRLEERYTSNPVITVLDKEALRRLPAGSLDLILINSVIQYVSRADLMTALSDLRRLLKPAGSVLIGDVIVPGTNLWQHIAVFLIFGYQNGFAMQALFGLFHNFLPSTYGSLRRNHGIAKYSEHDFLALLRDCGLAGKRLPRNIAVSPVRSSYLARIAAGPDAPAN